MDRKRRLIRGHQDLAREYDVPRGWTAPRFAEAWVPPVGTVVQCVWSDCSDFCVPDGVPGLLELVRDMEDSFLVSGDVVLPGMSQVVPDSWPQFAEARVTPVGTPVHYVENRVTQHPGVPFWILRFLFCHRDDRQRGLEAVLLCSHPGFWLNDIGRKAATDPGRGGRSPGSVMTLDIKI